MISVLLPTRGRPDMCKLSVESLLDAAHHTRHVEVLTRYDDDDKESWKERKLAAGITHRSGPRLGYARLNEYYNELAFKARGEWVFVWNDDAVMHTEGWDEVIHSYSPDVVLNPDSNHNNQGSGWAVFPVVPRSWTQIMGHLSRHRANDTYVEHVAKLLHRLVPVDVFVWHARCDLTGENDDDTWREGRTQQDSPGFYGPAVQADIRNDADKLREHFHSRVP